MRQIAKSIVSNKYSASLSFSCLCLWFLCNLHHLRSLNCKFIVNSAEVISGSFQWQKPANQTIGRKWGEKLSCSQEYIYMIVLHRHFLPGTYPSYRLDSAFCNLWPDHSKQCKDHCPLDVLLTFLPVMTQITGLGAVYVCTFIHSGNTNTPGVPELTATLSHKWYNAWDTEGPFVVSTHTLLTLAHSVNLTKEIHTSNVCVCVCVKTCISWEELSLLFRLRCQHLNIWANRWGDKEEK